MVCLKCLNYNTRVGDAVIYVRNYERKSVVHSIAYVAPPVQLRETLRCRKTALDMFAKTKEDAAMITCLVLGQFYVISCFRMLACPELTFCASKKFFEREKGACAEK